ncbi:MAG: MTAP family purine nucleoside phosphorylase, partial [Actinobacteria bacterium]|nr:MTAP family purine nucleoside phosphorylase [Actinomycetota bacterium]
MIGVFGGSGFTSLLERVEQVTIATPYGPTSAPFAVGEIDGRQVAFMPRHGLRHELPPAQVPYRANVWAMRELGVRRIVGPAACGSLRIDLGPGDFVVCDQFVDRTSGRSDTFYEGPETTHVGAAEPFCPGLRNLLVETAREHGITVHDGGTAVVIQGPRFSTRAESTWFASMG